METTTLAGNYGREATTKIPEHPVSVIGHGEVERRRIQLSALFEKFLRYPQGCLAHQDAAAFATTVVQALQDPERWEAAMVQNLPKSSKIWPAPIQWRLYCILLMICIHI